VWVELPVCLHRPLPENGTIQEASIVRRRIGVEWVYKVVITVRTPVVEKRCAGRPAVELTLNWKLQEDRSLEVASWKDSEGKSGTVIMPVTTTSQFDKVVDLQSIRDQYHNHAKAAVALLRSLRKKKNSDVLLPPWFLEESFAVVSWRNPKRRV